MLAVGIDPGLTGAVAIVSHMGLLGVFDLPTMKIPGVGPTAMVQNKIDGRALCKLLLSKVPADESARVVTEAVGTMGGANNAVQTQGSLLRSLGAIETVIECLNWQHQYVPSQTWKRKYGLVGPDKSTGLSQSARTTAIKKMALECARKLYPGCADIARAKDHNRAEAILLAHWLLRTAA